MTLYDQEWGEEKLLSRLGEFDEFPPAPVVGGSKISEEAIELYSPIFPRIMELFWRKYPIGSMLKGAYWLCDPTDFRPVVETVLHGDLNLDPRRTHVIAYTAFGQLVAWNEEHWPIEIDLLGGAVTASLYVYPEEKINADIVLVTSIETFESLEDLDEEDEDGKWLYNRAKKKLGPLAYGECYGFFPALPLGGPKRLENLRKVSAVEHFTMLAQMQDFVLMDYLSRPIREIRPIGAE